MSPLGLLLAGTLTMAAAMAAVFVWALRLGNFSIVDIAWSANFSVLVGIYAVLGSGNLTRRLVVAALVVAWSLRLAGHLYARIAALHPREEGRYVQLRKDWAGRLKLRFFAFFEAQAALNVLLSVPFLLACSDPRPGLGPFEIAGTVLLAVAVAGETAADRQLAAFKADPANRGRTCRTGLWRLSRHPNYFFEWLVWVAFAVFALPSPWGPVSLACPLLMLFLLFRVTGIPMTEKQALRARGDDYRDYQRTTSAFVPWFPRP